MERLAEGVTAAEEAVAMRRRLAAASPDAYKPALATSLNTVSIWYGDAGRRAEGLAAIEEAVAIYRRLAGANPGAYEQGLAAALNTLSVRYGGVGLTTIGETVAMYPAE
jgi:tetratricopeptide repeat protein